MELILAEPKEKSGPVKLNKANLRKPCKKDDLKKIEIIKIITKCSSPSHQP